TYMLDLPPLAPPGESEGDLTLANVDILLATGDQAFLDTCLGYVTPQIQKVCIMWNKSVDWDGMVNNSFSSFGVWLHETGHILGLAHRPASCPGKSNVVMHSGGTNMNETWNTFILQADDIARIQKLYPRETP